MIHRSNIYIGEVQRIHAVDENRKTKIYTPIRKILFAKTKDNYAFDLLQRKKLYPILNTPGVNTDLVVTNPSNLSNTLEFFGFKEHLNIKDIEYIKKYLLKILYFQNYLKESAKKIKTRTLSYAKKDNLN